MKVKLRKKECCLFNRRKNLGDVFFNFVYTSLTCNVLCYFVLLFELVQVINESFHNLLKLCFVQWRVIRFQPDLISVGKAENRFLD